MVFSKQTTECSGPLDNKTTVDIESSTVTIFPISPDRVRYGSPTALAAPGSIEWHSSPRTTTLATSRKALNVHHVAPLVVLFEKILPMRSATHVGHILDSRPKEYAPPSFPSPEEKLVEWAVQGRGKMSSEKSPWQQGEHMTLLR